MTGDSAPAPAGAWDTVTDTVSKSSQPTMHWLDRIGLAAARRPRIYDPIFSDGWGDRLGDALDLVRNPPDVPAPTNVEGLPIRVAGRVRHRWYRFPSPVLSLPQASTLAHVHLIEPEDPLGVVVWMAAFNDHGPDTRLQLARPLLDRGLAAAILENPYYGLRRPGDGQPMRTVADLLFMGSAATIEGLMTLEMLRSMGYDRAAVAGYSMGANIAGFVAALAALADRPVPCGALAASHSPGPVFTNGALAAAVDWEALGGFETGRPRLAEVLGEASVLRHPPTTAPAVIVGARQDGYIPVAATRALADHWPTAELRWLDGGHASVLQFQKPALAAAVWDAFVAQGASTRRS